MEESKLKLITRNKTKMLLNRLFLPRETILKQEGPNCILVRTVVVCGSQASGKTELFNSMVAHANNVYNPENVNAMISNGNPQGMIHRNFSDQLIQLICVDDATQAFSRRNKDGMRQINAFFNLRGYAQKAGMRKGLIVVFFNTHRFHSIPPEFRTESFYIIFKSLPTNPYDRRVVENYVGGNGIEDLRDISLHKEMDLSINRYSICYSYDGKIGLLDLKLSEVDNLYRQSNDSDDELIEIYKAAGIDLDRDIDQLNLPSALTHTTSHTNTLNTKTEKESKYDPIIDEVLQGEHSLVKVEVENKDANQLQIQLSKRIKARGITDKIKASVANNFAYLKKP